MKGKLVAEAAAAKPVPDIAAGTLHGLRARVSGTVVRTNLLAGRSRRPRPGRRSRSGPHRDSPRRTGRNAHLSACGGQCPGAVRVGKRAGYRPDAAHRTAHRAADRASDAVLGRSCCRSALLASCSGQGRGRSHRPALPARSLRASRSCFYRRNDILLQSFHRFGADRRAGSGPCKAAKQTRLYSRHWPDFELLARKEDVFVEENTLHYRVVYTITADICK